MNGSTRVLSTSASPASPPSPGRTRRAATSRSTSPSSSLNQEKKEVKRPRTVKQSTTESWDDDFEFPSNAVASTSSSSSSALAPLIHHRPRRAPAATTSTKPRHDSRHIQTVASTRSTSDDWNESAAMSSRNVSSSSSTSYNSSVLRIAPSTPATSARTSSFSSAYFPPPLSLAKPTVYTSELPNTSLESLASTWSIDQDPDPTVTLSQPQPSSVSPSSVAELTPLPPGARYDSSATPRASTLLLGARDAVHRRFDTRRSVIDRSDTPSLGRSGILTAEEYTEAETEEDAPGPHPLESPRTRRWSQASSSTSVDIKTKHEMPPPPVPSRSASRKWNRISGIFASSGSARSNSTIEEQGSQSSSIHRSSRSPKESPTTEESPSSVFDASGTGLQRSSGAEFVVLGRKTRLSVDSMTTTDDEQPPRSRSSLGPPDSPRLPHSSTESTWTLESTGGSGTEWWSSNRPGNTSRRSLTFAPPPTPPPRRSRDGYRGTDDEGGVTTMDEEIETTEAEISGDEDPTKARMMATSSCPAVSTPVPIRHSGSSFPSSAKEFGLAPASISPSGLEVNPRPGHEWTHAGAVNSKRKRKLVKKRPPSAKGEYDLQEQEDVLSESSETKMSTSDVRRPLLSSAASITSSNGRSEMTISETSTYRSPVNASFPSTAILSSPTLATGMQIGSLQNSEAAVQSSRRGSATAPLAPRSVGEKGSVVEAPGDPEWLAVEAFPVSPDIAGRTSPALSKEPLAQRPPSRVLRRKSLGKSSHPPVTGKTQAEKRSSTFVGMLSRSASSLPLVGRRAPSPSPSLQPTPSSALPSHRSEKPMIRSASSSALPVQSSTRPGPSPVPHSKDRRPQSMSAAVHVSPPSPATKREFSFLTRARAFSKGKSSRPSTPTGVPISCESPRSRMDQSFGVSSTIRVYADDARPRSRLGEGRSIFRPPSTHSDYSEGTIRAESNADVSSAVIITSQLLTSPTSSFSTARDSTRARAPFVKGHRPSLSLTSAMPVRPKSWSVPALRLETPSTEVSATTRSFQGSKGHHRPRLTMASESQASRLWDEDYPDTAPSADMTRRNSLGDLKIPQRISNAQAKIEEDLERVKEFARGIEELKTVRRQYQQLLQLVPSSLPSSLGVVESSHPWSGIAESSKASATAIRRLDIDYRQWWEQADALVDLGDGTPRAAEPRETPGSIASRRDRCVSLAPSHPRKALWEVSPSQNDQTPEWGSILRGAPSVSPAVSPARLGRRPSDSSIEVRAVRSGVARRQHEMLKGVLVSANKGASLPSRGLPSPRPTLSDLATIDSGGSRRSVSASLPVQADVTPSKKMRRASKAGVSGIKDFLLRLRVKSTTEALALPTLTPMNTSGMPPLPIWNRSSSEPHAFSKSTMNVRDMSDEEEDWDQQEPSPPRHSPLASRGLTLDSKVNGAGLERMVLTTDAMPALVSKVGEVKQRCVECVERLKAMTSLGLVE